MHEHIEEDRSPTIGTSLIAHPSVAQMETQGQRQSNSQPRAPIPAESVGRPLPHRPPQENPSPKRRVAWFCLPVVCYNFERLLARRPLNPEDSRRPCGTHWDHRDPCRCNAEDRNKPCRPERNNVIAVLHNTFGERIIPGTQCRARFRPLPTLAEAAQDREAENGRRVHNLKIGKAEEDAEASEEIHRNLPISVHRPPQRGVAPASEHQCRVVSLGRHPPAPLPETPRRPSAARRPPCRASQRSNVVGAGVGPHGLVVALALFGGPWATALCHGPGGGRVGADPGGLRPPRGGERQPILLPGAMLQATLPQPSTSAENHAIRSP